MKILGLIPARGGSKGIPGKNIKVLGDKPLIQYTWEDARKSSLLTKVILSTEDETIASIGQSLGIEVPFKRPENLAQDTTSTLTVVQHALNFFIGRSIYFDAVCILQPTSPFRSSRFIDLAIQRFVDQGADSLVSVLPVPHEYNPHWVFESDPNDFLKIATGEKEIVPRRQDLPKAFHRDGSVYIVKTSVVIEQNSLYGNSIAFIESDPALYVNLDSPEDWDKAVLLLKRLYN